MCVHGICSPYVNDFGDYMQFLVLFNQFILLFVLLLFDYTEMDSNVPSICAVALQLATFVAIIYCMVYSNRDILKQLAAQVGGQESRHQTNADAGNRKRAADQPSPSAADELASPRSTGSTDSSFLSEDNMMAMEMPTLQMPPSTLHEDMVRVNNPTASYGDSSTMGITSPSRDAINISDSISEILRRTAQITSDQEYLNEMLHITGIKNVLCNTDPVDGNAVAVGDYDSDEEP
ncbi:hypothetical protein CYMTET_41620 [Cymbomonas tetramitiformis]|uniref:Uncharacterized protein n=1 Tax=Cymbomonas tetramitiformis TaxID=36881 RepID=A0AAE0F2C0_9CHLO|nr:hypothetical protein CYMTET_41620 [Cymbomonas tetramitiformis]